LQTQLKYDVESGDAAVLERGHLTRFLLSGLEVAQIKFAGEI